MGLDVSLYRCPDLQHAIKMEKDYEAELDRVYEEWERLQKDRVPSVGDEEDFNKKRLALKDKYGIDDYHHKTHETIYYDSKTEPDHLFKIGYMRSSYNGTGINRVANVFDLPDLYEIFEVTSDQEYYIQHDWDRVYTNLKAAIEKWQTHAESPQGRYNIYHYRSSIWRSAVNSDTEALERFNIEYLNKKEEIDKDEYKSAGWASKQGEFYPKPLKVAAIIAGAWDPNKPITMFNEPSSYLVLEDDDNSGFMWYVTALRIVQEMVEMILEQPNPKEYFMGWSG